MKKIFLAALAATTLFASCAKEDNGAQDNGAEANLDLVISFPKTETRAGQNNYASDQDVKITTVKVFIFNADGTHATGSPSADFTLADFTAEGNEVYSLLPGKRITTTAGSKKVYVGINLPAALVATITSEGALINAASTVGLYTTEHVAMLSAGIDTDLKAYENDSDPTPASNKVVVPVVRLVAKVAATKGSGYSSTPSNSSDGGAFFVDADMFTVGNLAEEFYPVQRTTGDDLNKVLVTPALADPTTPLLPQKDLNLTSVAVKDLASFYVPELAGNSSSRRQDATYAVVRGKLTFNSFATYNETTKIIELTAASSHTGDLFVVNQGTNTYFCATADDATAVAVKLGVDPTKINTYKDAGSGEYYTFYYLFLNKDDDKKTVGVWRNQFIHYTVTGVKGIGVPGDPGAPENPPTEIPDPFVPIFDLPAYLEVIVDVQAWSYKSYNVPLE